MIVFDAYGSSNVSRLIKYTNSSKEYPNVFFKKLTQVAHREVSANTPTHPSFFLKTPHKAASSMKKAVAQSA